MRALVWDGTLRYEPDYPDPVPRADEALIRVHMAGICNTDLEITRGYKGFQGILGHEFVGEVVTAPDPTWVGKRVVGEINITCGRCYYCTHGMPTHCERRSALGIFGHDGAFAEYLTLPLRNLHPVPPSVPDHVAVFTEPLAAALEVLEQVHVRPSDSVVVVGDGKLGLLIAQVMALTGATVTLAGRHPERLALAETWGLRSVLVPRGEPFTPPRLPSAHGKGDVVVECTGTGEGFAVARSFVRPRGTMVLKSTYHGLAQVDLTSVVVDEVHLVGTRCGPFPPALRLLQEGRVDVESLVERVFPLEQGVDAFTYARGRLKVLLRMGEPTAAHDR